jgi:ankyrin repeat protein
LCSSSSIDTSWQGHLDVVKCLVEIGASYDLPTKFGVTPLHVVARKGHIDIFLYLVSQGVNLDATTQRGATPLYVILR